MRAEIRLNNGSGKDGKTRYRTHGTEPVADYIEVADDESLGSIAVRAYGANTAANREKLVRANASFSGRVRVPR